MEERLVVVLAVLGVGAGVVALWPRIDQALDWLAAHLPSAPVVMCGAGLAVCVPALLAGAVPIALPGAALALSGAVVHRVCLQADLGIRRASGGPGMGTGPS